ncbi:hypothetical protein BDV23DRAFT_165623 [Aspergillus alliaceus]|uniref:Transmembrane protein n=1 Tax=Petromyces alliaceus TaxID=209559 RepID=A0A5N7BTB1_PETAA|nr:hypothetical protein BDV23DRAFT_165623 [Aspergillus alliaceus]
MAAARLRKAFHYPEDSDDDKHEREELDEEEQESVIERLRAQNDKRDAEYSILFAIIPLLSVSMFIPSVCSRSSDMQERLLSFLSTLSLIATAYIMKSFPLQNPDPKGKRPIQSPGFLALFQKLLLPINTAACSLLLLVYIFSSPVQSSFSKQPTTYIVPGAMLAIIMLARKIMVSIDLKHLEDLQYRYKGA